MKSRSIAYQTRQNHRTRSTGGAHPDIQPVNAAGSPARYGSQCPRCGRDILPGAPISPSSRSGRYCHLTCDADRVDRQTCAVCQCPLTPGPAKSDLLRSSVHAGCVTEPSKCA